MSSCILSSGEFLIISPLGKLLYEDPLHTDYIKLHHAWGVNINGEKFIAPKDFASDGGSVPKLFWRVAGHPFSKARPGYILHDAAYHKVLVYINKDGDKRLLEKDEADELMYQVAIWNGMDKLQMKAIYEAVHLFGGSTWKKHPETHLANQLVRMLDYTPVEKD